ncbi:unnamed protein product [Coregonus sp. 'balchen']|nr:unnamed protein product [Coregonus sp. 'balchen']
MVTLNTQQQQHNLLSLRGARPAPVLHPPCRAPGLIQPIAFIDEWRKRMMRDIRNTVGNIPMEWYQDYPHIGYDLDGKKIFKPIRNKDELDEFLDKMENPDYWRTVHDKTTASDIRLSDEQVDLVHRLQKGQFGDVSKLVHAIKMGWIKPRKPKETTPQYYDLWAKEDPNAILGRHKMHVPAPKMRLPGHEESYNPPPEYLLTEEERLAWEQQDAEDRKLPFLPQKHSCLRAVPAFSRFIHERFERCLDLYLCPRQRKMRVYRGHTSLVRSISASPTGQWLVSGSVMYGCVPQAVSCMAVFPRQSHVWLCAPGSVMYGCVPQAVSCMAVFPRQCHDGCVPQAVLRYVRGLSQAGSPGTEASVRSQQEEHSPVNQSAITPTSGTTTKMLP